MGRNEVSGDNGSSLPYADFIFRFGKYQTGERVIATVLTDRAKKYGTTMVLGSAGDVSTGRAGMMFNARLLCVEQNKESEQNNPLAILSTDDGNYIVCFVEFSGSEPRLNDNAWGMITSPLELVRFEKTASQLRTLLLTKQSHNISPVQR